MNIKDILPARPVVEIMVRTNAPSDYPYQDMLFGYCSWDGEKIISLDGDSYSEDWIITGYEWENNESLVVWIESDWRCEI